MTKAIATQTHAPADHDPRWAAILARDPDLDGKFVIAVTTTKIFCRPTCPARRPKPQNVIFYDTCRDAERAGFRACRRCRPNGTLPAREHADLVAAACRKIEQSDGEQTLPALAASAGMSPFHFHRLFKAATGLTPKAYGDAHRSKRVRSELADRHNSVTEAIYGAGFNSNGRFYARSNGVLGMTPTAFRSGGADVDIKFAVGECSLGSILVALSGKGVCAILLGDNPDELARDLQDRFPRANLVGGDAEFDERVATVVGLVEAPGLGLALPLDVRGTAFQQRVWQALRAVPAGKTASYTEIARRIGMPKAARAVAQACAANNIAVAIPCHRVVRNDGSLSGYRWGVERKRALLAKEAHA